MALYKVLVPLITKNISAGLKVKAFTDDTKTETTIVMANC